MLETRLVELEIATDWRERAACLDLPTDLFFPAGETGPAEVQIRQAKEVCARCDVSDDCLLYALEANQRDGIWGGMTGDERKRLRRRWLAERRRRTG